MNDNRVWKVLGIEETKDEQEIKLAYYEKLKTTNPEDDPEGFMELREAYDRAVQLCHKKEEEAGEEKEKTPVDLWIDKAAELYHHLSRRIDENAWKELLADDLCQNLDTSAQVAEQFLVFAMDQPYYPNKIWKLFDQAFSIRDLYDEYLEMFPKDFLDFVLRQIDQEIFVDFRYFEGADDADYDTFIRTFFQLKAANDEGDVDEAGKIIREMEDMMIEHPLFQVEKMRTIIARANKEERDEKDKVAAIIESIEEWQIEDSYYMTYYQGEGYWYLEEYEKARACYEKMEEQAPNQPASMYGLAKYYLHAEDYDQAKEICLDVMELHGESEEIMNMLKKANDALLIRQEEKMRTDPEDYDNIFEVGWCYFQNERIQECMDLLQKVSQSEAYAVRQDEQVAFDYHNLLGRCYLVQDNYKDAIEHIQIWRDALEKLEDDGTEKTKKKLARKGFANYAVGMCYYELGREKKEIRQKVDEDKIHKAIFYMEKAMENISEKHPEDALGYRERLAVCYVELGQYEKAKAYCDDALEIDDTFFPAYVTRQQVYYHMGDAQGVVDDYYHAVELYPVYAKPYVYACKVFNDFRQYQDAIGVVERARENGVEDSELELGYIRAVRNITPINREFVEKLLPLLEKLEKTMEEENSAYLSGLYMEYGFFYMDIENYRNALSYVDKAVNLEPDNSALRWTKADILTRMGKYEAAMEIYQSIEKFYQDSADYYYDLGSCVRGFEENGGGLKSGKTAISFFLKAAKLDPGHARVNHELMDFYQEKYQELHHPEDYQKAVDYATKQLEIHRNRYHYLCRAFVYYDGYELDKALEDFKEGIKIEPDGVYAYNGAGLVYSLKDQYEPAKTMFLKAIENMEGKETYAPYRNLVDTLIAMGDTREAVNWARKFMEMFPGEVQAYERLAKALIRSGDFQGGIDVYKEYLEQLFDRTKKAEKVNNYNEIGRLSDQIVETYSHIANTYGAMGDLKNAEAYYKKPLKKYAVIPSNKNIAGFYLSIGEYKKALHHYRLLLGKDDMNENYYDYENILMRTAICHGALKQPARAKKYFDKVISFLTAKYGSVDNYVNYPPYKMMRCYNMGELYFFLGDYDKVKYYLNEMFSGTKCRTCTYGQCYERIVVQAMLLEMEGKKEEACQLYEKALAIEPDMLICRTRIKALKGSR